MQPHTLPGVAVDREATLVHVEQHPAVFVVLLRAPAGGEAYWPRVAAPGPGAFGAFGVGAAMSVRGGAGHGEGHAAGDLGAPEIRALRGWPSSLAAAGRTKGTAGLPAHRPGLKAVETAHTAAQ